MAALRLFLIIGIVVSAMLGIAWVLGLVPDEEAQRLLAKTASVVGILVAAVLGIFMVSGTKQGGRK